MATQSLAVGSLAGSERRAARGRGCWTVMFTASVWMAGILFFYVGTEEAPSESAVMLLFGAGLSRLGSAVAARGGSVR